ncbi:MAG: HAMP domain-containing histidine kinase [Epulopiscium sp.]|jgi:signal transduction histidine kinase|nr:HAMP domain-containing histidine kinase [Candidatus Epulonipiscium sp.]
MERRKNILKNTFKFIALFIIFNILFFIVMSAIMLFPVGKIMPDFVPTAEQVEADDLDWEAINEIGGYGLVIDNEGKVIKSYYQKDDKKSYTHIELVNLLDIRDYEKTVFSFTTMDNNKLLIIYPSSAFNTIPSMDMSVVEKKQPYYYPILFVVGLVIYIFMIYILISRLTKKIKVEFDLIKAEEDKKENMFLRGLAHDIKTPLSTIITYAKALEDGIVEKGEEQEYNKVIYNNGIILKERVENMLSLTSLGDKGIFSPQDGDILEELRRFVGDNYSWYIKNNTTINIEFSDKSRFVTKYDRKLFVRLLENLLQNSVHHNDKAVNIFIEWDSKDKKLIIYDDGRGVPENIRAYMWEPMVTGEESRTGEKLRGIGLANVKRIVELHGWEIEYDGKFNIKIK